MGPVGLYGGGGADISFYVPRSIHWGVSRGCQWSPWHEGGKREWISHIVLFSERSRCCVFTFTVHCCAKSLPPCRHPQVCRHSFRTSLVVLAKSELGFGQVSKSGIVGFGCGSSETPAPKFRRRNSGAETPERNLRKKSNNETCPLPSSHASLHCHSLHFLIAWDVHW